RRPAGVDPYAKADRRVACDVGPVVLAERALDVERRAERVRRTLEHREILVGARVDLVTARSAHARSNERADLAQQARVTVAEGAKQIGRGLDVAHQERHLPSREARDVDGPSLDLGLQALVADLTVEEADRHD